jgi:hypothetical protein
MMQCDDMPNDASLTVRIPVSLKKRLEARARQGHRSLSAQVLHDLEATVAASAAASGPGRFLGRFAGTPVPTDAEIREVRARLWGKLTDPAPSRVKATRDA